MNRQRMFLSHKSCLTLTAERQAPLSSISWSLLKFMSIELVMLSNHLILCHPLHFLPSVFHSLRVFFSESALCIRHSKYWSFSFSSSPSSEYSGLISFGIDWFDLAVQDKGLSRVVFSTTIQKHQFFCIQPSLWFNSQNHSWLLEKTGYILALFIFLKITLAISGSFVVS